MVRVRVSVSVMVPPSDYVPIKNISVQFTKLHVKKLIHAVLCTALFIFGWVQFCTAPITDLWTLTKADKD